MNIRHHGDGRLCRDKLKRIGGFLVGHRHAHDVAADGFNRAYLLQGAVNVGREGFRHRLHGDRRAAADLDRPNLYPPRLSAFHAISF